MQVRDLINRHGSEIVGVLASLGVNQALANGNVFFVDSGASQAFDDNDGEHGQTWDMPFATIDYAVGRCTANNGDIILVAPGHTETVDEAGGLDLDVAGITVVGLGPKGVRPTINVGADTTAGCDIDVDAANITLQGFDINATAVDVTAMVDVNSTGFTIKDCFIEMHEDGSSKYEALVGIDVDGGSSNAADDFQCLGCEIRAYKGTEDGSDAAIEIGDVQDSIVIADCTVIGNFDDACIHSASACTGIVVRDCYLQNDATQHSIEFSAAATGALIRNMYNNDMTQATGVDPGSCRSFECYHCDAVNTSGVLAPAAT